MLENDITDVLDLCFAEETDYFGRKSLVELKPGGKDIKVCVGVGGGSQLSWPCPPPAPVARIASFQAPTALP